MSAFASIESASVPPARPAATVGVYRYSPGGLGGYGSLPNVRVLTIQFREGADAGVARFRYVFDGARPATDPDSFQDALSVDATMPGIVADDERLVVLGSFNFSDNANTSNDENLLIIDNPEIARAFLAEYERIVAVAKDPPRRR